MQINHTRFGARWLLSKDVQRQVLQLGRHNDNPSVHAVEDYLYAKTGDIAFKRQQGSLNHSLWYHVGLESGQGVVYTNTPNEKSRGGDFSHLLHSLHTESYAGAAIQPADLIWKDVAASKQRGTLYTDFFHVTQRGRDPHGKDAETNGGSAPHYSDVYDNSPEASLVHSRSLARRKKNQGSAE